jgi:hypothetical protein
MKRKGADVYDIKKQVREGGVIRVWGEGRYTQAKRGRLTYASYICDDDRWRFLKNAK